LQDYYAADTNGDTIPEEYGTQLLLADLAGVEHIAPKLSLQTECNGHTVTLTGILPQSEFDAQVAWKGVQAFKKSCGNCSKRVVLDDSSGSAAEGLAKGRFVSDIAKDEVICGADAATKIGVKMGDRLKLFDKSFRVGGVMPATGTLDDGRVFAHLHTVQPLPRPARTSTSSRSWHVAKTRRADSLASCASCSRPRRCSRLRKSSTRRLP
jgi:putative ABC transport system permease protein